MPTISPFLWYDTQAEEAVQQYIKAFGDGHIVTKTYYTEAASRAAGQPVGSLMMIECELLGQKLWAMNAGPAFHFNPSISLFVRCTS